MKIKNETSWMGFRCYHKITYKFADQHPRTEKLPCRNRDSLGGTDKLKALGNEPIT